MASVSVIIPVYNREEYLRAALDSVFAQTRLPDEVIVVDDGSTDSTPAVAESFPGVKLICQANGGVSAARNRAIEAASSEWLAFLDSDDLWHPDKLKLQMAALEAHTGFEVCTCNTLGLEEEGAHSPPPSRLSPQDDIVAGLRGSLRLPPGSIVAKRDRVLQVGGFDQSARWSEDWDLWLRLAAVGCRFLVVPEALLLIRSHESNLSNESYRMMDAELLVWERHIGTQFSPVSRALRRRIARSHFLGRVSLVEREQRRPHLGIMARSLLLSPLGDWQRHRVFLHMLLTRLGLLRSRTA